MNKAVTLQKVCIGIIVCSAFIGSILVYKSGFSFPVISDADDYHQIATTLVADGYYRTISDKEIIYPPLYPLSIALIYKVFGVGNTNILYALQYLFVGTISIFSYLIMTKRFGAHPYVALLGALLILFWPYFLTYTFIVTSELLYALFLIIPFFFLTKEIQTTKDYMLAGLFFGLATLTRPVSLLLPLFIILVAFIDNHLLRKTRVQLPTFNLKASLAMLAVFVLTLVPWQLYVATVHHRFIPIASNLSYVFEKANKTRAYLVPEENSPSFLEAKLKNIYLFWNPGASGYQSELITKKFPMAVTGIVLYKIIFYFLVITAIVGLFFILQTLPRSSLLIYPIIYTWALHTVLFPFPRYTLPIMPFVIIVALIVINYGFKQYKTKYSHRLTS